VEQGLTECSKVGGPDTLAAHRGKNVGRPRPNSFRRLWLLLFCLYCPAGCWCFCDVNAWALSHSLGAFTFTQCYPS